MTAVAYNPSDPTQQSFLSSLALGETGNSSFASMEGVGGVNLSGTSTDQYGFPEWSGDSNSHAAGTFQFQPATWDQEASQYNLNFQNPSDQQAGAWYLAQQTYAQQNGGASLETALQNGDYSQVQSSLASVWPSVTGNQAAPQGLAANLASGTGASLSGGSSASGASSTSSGSNLLADVENFFVRFGLIIIGGVVIIVALWQLLASQGAVPSPGDTAKAVGHAATALVAA